MNNSQEELSIIGEAQKLAADPHNRAIATAIVHPRNRDKLRGPFLLEAPDFEFGLIGLWIMAEAFLRSAEKHPDHGWPDHHAQVADGLNSDEDLWIAHRLWSIEWERRGGDVEAEREVDD